MDELLSVVVPTKNSGDCLKACLDSIRSQTYRKFELIVVDGYSTDSTLQIARKYADKVLLSKRSLPGARNLGFSKARGSIFLSIDSDMILEPGLFGDIVARFNSHGALIIPEAGYGTNFLSRCKDLEKRCYLGDPIIESARAFRPAAFGKVGGYDENLHFAEDWDLHCRLKDGFSIGRTESKVLHNTQNLTLSHDLKKAFIYGKTLPRYLDKKTSQSEKWLNPANFFFIRHFSKLAREPVEGIGLTAIKGMEYTAGFIGFASAKLGL
ncbi:MAG TPA: glycosyltransferase [Candidatus Bilamarchaeum sp.]|nr:glycosyltransferase [Candidatus Bilamarchaeum sp.]